MSRNALFALAAALGLAIGTGYLIGTRMIGDSGGSGGLLESFGSPGADSLDCSRNRDLMAVVNGLPVTTVDVDAELSVQKSLQARQGVVMPEDPETLRSFRRELLDQVLDQYALLAAAQAAGYDLTTEQAMAELPALLQRYNADAAIVQQNALADGVSEAGFASWARRQAINGRYLQSQSPYSQPSDVAERMQKEGQLDLRICMGGRAVVPATEGQPAPDFQLATPEGGSMSLSDFRGQAVMINFWATWCAPCKVEMPLFVNAYQQNPEKLVVLAVNVEESAQQVQPYVQQNGLVFPVVLDQEGQVSLLYRVRALPTTYFVDADGMLVQKHRGAILNRPQLQPFLDRILPGAVQGMRWPGLEPFAGSVPGRSPVVDPHFGAG